MSKSLFSFGIFINEGKKESIKIVAEYVWNFLIAIKGFDTDENSFCFIDNKNKRHSLNILEIAKEAELIAIADHILQYHKSDIKKYDLLKEPTIEFERDWGFSFLIAWNKSGKEVVCFHLNLGRADDTNGISTMTFSEDYEKDFVWYYTTLQKLVKFTQPLTAAVHFKVNIFSGERPRVIIEPGWITYVSNKTGLQLPLPLIDVEIDQADGGNYIIVTRDDITKSKEYYEVIKKRVISLHCQLIEKVDGYVIKENGVAS